MREDVQCFKDIFIYAMERSGIRCQKLEDILVVKGTGNIRMKRLSEYQRGISTPPFEKAKKIMEALDYDIDDEELLASLEKNRENIRNEINYTVENREPIKEVTFRFSNIFPGIDPYATESLVDDRVEELFGDRRNYQQYIRKLIADDIKGIMGKENR